MIPFSSFMQAVSPIADMGAKTAAGGDWIKKGTGEFSGAESESSFWGWLLKLTTAENVTTVEGEASLGNPTSGEMPEASDWGQFVALIARAKHQYSGDSGDALKLPTNEIETLAELFQQIETTVPEENGAEHAAPGTIPQSLPAFLEKMGISGPFPGKELPLGKAEIVPQPERAPAFPEPTAQLAENNPGMPDKGAPLAEAEQGAVPSRNPGKEWPWTGEPATAVDELTEGEKRNAAGMQQRTIVSKDNAADPEAFVPAKNKMVQTNERAAQTGFDDGRQMRFDENGQPRFKENTREQLLNSNEAVDFKGKEETERPILDPVKNAGSDLNRSSENFQAADKTPLTGKTNSLSAPVMNRMDAPADRAFQTTVMDQIVEKISLRSFPGRSEMQIRLKPEFLGNVQMHITAEKEQLVVRMVTDHAAVKEILETNLHHLKTELQNQGMTIDRFDIMVNPDGEQHPSRDQFAQMFKQSPSQHEGRRDRNPGSDADAQDRGKRENEERTDEDGINYFA